MSGLNYVAHASYPNAMEGIDGAGQVVREAGSLIQGTIDRHFRASKRQRANSEGQYNEKEAPPLAAPPLANDGANIITDSAGATTGGVNSAPGQALLSTISPSLGPATTNVFRFKKAIPIQFKVSSGEVITNTTVNTDTKQLSVNIYKNWYIVPWQSSAFYMSKDEQNFINAQPKHRYLRWGYNFSNFQTHTARLISDQPSWIENVSGVWCSSCIMPASEMPPFCGVNSNGVILHHEDIGNDLYDTGRFKPVDWHPLINSMTQYNGDEKMQATMNLSAMSTGQLNAPAHTGQVFESKTKEWISVTVAPSNNMFLSKTASVAQAPWAKLATDQKQGNYPQTKSKGLKQCNALMTQKSVGLSYENIDPRSYVAQSIVPHWNSVNIGILGTPDLGDNRYSTYGRDGGDFHAFRFLIPTPPGTTNEEPEMFVTAVLETEIEVEVDFAMQRRAMVAAFENNVLSQRDSYDRYVWKDGEINQSAAQYQLPGLYNLKIGEKNYLAHSYLGAAATMEHHGVNVEENQFNTYT